MDYLRKIIEYIAVNRITTTEVADALSKTGALPGILPINRGLHKVGKVRCIFAAHSSNYAVHEQVKQIEPGEIPVVFVHDCDNRAIFGELVSKYILFYRRAEAVVVDGMVRDMAGIVRERFSVWVRGFTPLGCFNKKAKPFPKDKKAKILKKHSGGVAVCDDGGVVIIPPDKLDKDMLERLRLIEDQEDIWKFCLNNLKWDTKKIVCDKAYLNEPELLSPVHIKSISKLSEHVNRK